MALIVHPRGGLPDAQGTRCQISDAMVDVNWDADVIIPNMSNDDGFNFSFMVYRNGYQWAVE